MKIALLGPMFPFRGGIAHFLETMYYGLKDRGHDITAVTFKRQYPEFLFPGRTQMEESPSEHTVPAVRLLDTLNPWTWFSTARFIYRGSNDAILFKYWMPFFGPSFGTVARLLRFKQVKSIAVVDNAIPHEKRPGDLVLSKYLLKACHGLIVMSDAVENDVRRLGINRRIVKIAHPVYDIFGKPIDKREARVRLGLPIENPIALFFGFIRRYKGLQILLESIPEIVKAVPGFKLVVAGEWYENSAPYLQIIEQLGIKDQVILRTEYIPNEVVKEYFSASDVVVQPYISATQSGVAQIAFQFDRPLIVTDVGGLAEVVPNDKAGMVVPPSDPNRLSAAVTRFFRENLMQRFTEGILEEKWKYSWDPLYNAVEKLTQD